MGLEQVEQHLSHVSGMTGPQLEEHLQNLLLLLRENPGWGISLLPSNDEAVSQLVVKEPVISWYCWLGLQLANLFSLAVKLAGYLACLMLVGAVLWLAVWLWGKMTERSERQRQEVFDLVERVLSILFHQHQAVIREGKQGPTYLAIDHIRDQLIPPADRRSKAAVWEKVVQYIRNQESRVRDDVQTIFGEEFRVWQWLPDIPWSPRVSASPSLAPLPPRPVVPGAHHCRHSWLAGISISTGKTRSRPTSSANTLSQGSSHVRPQEPESRLGSGHQGGDSTPLLQLVHSPYRCRHRVCRGNSVHQDQQSR